MLEKLKQRFQGGGAKNFNFEHLLAFSLLVVFFVSVILFYHTMLFREKRENIIWNGQATVMQSTYHLREYFSTCIDVVKLTSYSVEEMMAGYPIVIERFKIMRQLIINEFGINLK